MFHLNLLLFLALPVLYQHLLASEEFDCRTGYTPEMMISCCANTSLIHEAVRNCSSDNPASSCYDDCILNYLGLVNNVTAEMEEAPTILENIYNGTSELLPMVNRVYNSCVIQAVDHLEDYGDYFSGVPHCSKIANLLLPCLFFNVFNQCPEADFQNHTKCLHYQRKVAVCSS